ncbi:hypothetical protein NKI15_03140 [Mesorhizobium sp. M0862]|uniref:hypothetical protein n=1 Tax=Mesorhizobium sp. M0862 TaxID=2957015 RepID=UPI003337F1DD
MNISASVSSPSRSAARFVASPALLMMPPPTYLTMSKTAAAGEAELSSDVIIRFGSVALPEPWGRMVACKTSKSLPMKKPQQD